MIIITFAQIHDMGDQVGLMPATDEGIKYLASFVLQRQNIGLQRYLMKMSIDHENERVIVK